MVAFFLMWGEKKSIQASNKGEVEHQSFQKANGNSFVSQMCFPVLPYMTSAVGEALEVADNSSRLPCTHHRLLAGPRTASSSALPQCKQEGH